MWIVDLEDALNEAIIMMYSWLCDEISFNSYIYGCLWCGNNFKRKDEKIFSIH